MPQETKTGGSGAINVPGRHEIFAIINSLSFNFVQYIPKIFYSQEKSRSAARLQQTDFFRNKTMKIHSNFNIAHFADFTYKPKAQG